MAFPPPQSQLSDRRGQLGSRIRHKGGSGLRTEVDVIATNLFLGHENSGGCELVTQSSRKSRVPVAKERAMQGHAPVLTARQPPSEREAPGSCGHIVQSSLRQ